MVTSPEIKISYLSIERYSIELLLLVFGFVGVEWFYRNRQEPISGKYAMIKIVFVLLAIMMLGSYSNPQDFIYFQF